MGKILATSEPGKKERLPRSANTDPDPGGNLNSDTPGSVSETIFFLSKQSHGPVLDLVRLLFRRIAELEQNPAGAGETNL